MFFIHISLVILYVRNQHLTTFNLINSLQIEINNTLCTPKNGNAKKRPNRRLKNHKANVLKMLTTYSQMFVIEQKKTKRKIGIQNKKEHMILGIKFHVDVSP